MFGASPEVSPRSSAVSLPPARARVLFVDDDRLQREMAQDALGERVELECLPAPTRRWHRSRAARPRSW